MKKIVYYRNKQNGSVLASSHPLAWDDNPEYERFPNQEEGYAIYRAICKQKLLDIFATQNQPCIYWVAKAKGKANIFTVFEGTVFSLCWLIGQALDYELDNDYYLLAGANQDRAVENVLCGLRDELGVSVDCRHL